MRALSLVLSAIWIGGLVVLGGVAAPVAFAVLQGHDPVAGRALAGELFGATLTRFQHLLWIVGAVQFVLIGTRAAIGPRPRRFKWQLAILTAMLAATTYSALVIGPKIDGIRTTTPVAIATLADDNPVKREFGQLHGLSNGLMALALVGALAMCWFDTKE
ncbi:MAG: DUF4149 domain-containing protein [Acidobacteria bacterium]|nr:DUF4149 domain-containing protein [Acidobacteriota bacterium]